MPEEPSGQETSCQRVKATNILSSWFALHPLFLDLGLTAATEFLVLVGGLLVVSLFSRTLGAVGLAEYLLLRRIASWVQSGTQPGLATALPRYVAHAAERAGPERDAYFLAGLACGGGLTLCLGIVLNVARGAFARWLFGRAQMAHLILPLSLMLVGLAGHNSVYGYYRGRLAMKRANALQLCNLVLVPVGAVLGLFRTGSVALILSMVGVLMLVGAGLFAAPLLRQFAAGGLPRFGRHAAELMRYAIPRLPGALGQGAIFALGPMIAAHYVPVTQVSFLLLGVSLVMAATTSVTPLSLILLSKVSMMLAQDRLPELRIRLAYLQAAVLELYVFACLQVVVFADVMIRVWVGPSFLKGIVIIRLLSLAIPFYLWFVVLRGAIDAASVTPYNVYNMLLSAAAFLGLAAAAVKLAPGSLLLELIAGAMVAAVVFLAWLTNLTFQRLYELGIDWKRSALSVLVAVLLGGTSLLLHGAQGFRTSLGRFLLIELATGALFIGLLKYLHSPWLQFFWNLAFRGDIRGGRRSSPESLGKGGG